MQQSERIINFLINLKGRGFRDSTVEGYSRIMRNMAKSCNLDNPEEIKEFIANKEGKDSRKEKLVNYYNNYLGWRGLT